MKYVKYDTWDPEKHTLFQLAEPDEAHPQNGDDIIIVRGGHYTINNANILMAEIMQAAMVYFVREFKEKAITASTAWFQVGIEMVNMQNGIRSDVVTRLPKPKPKSKSKKKGRK